MVTAHCLWMGALASRDWRIIRDTNDSHMLELYTWSAERTPNTGNNQQGQITTSPVFSPCNLAMMVTSYLNVWWMYGNDGRWWLHETCVVGVYLLIKSQDPEFGTLECSKWVMGSVWIPGVHAVSHGIRNLDPGSALNTSRDTLLNFTIP